MKIWNVICPVCGFKKKSTDMAKRWDNLWVCKEDWEPRHPMDFFRQRVEDITVPFTYPDSAVPDTHVCSATGRSGQAGYAEAGCAIAGLSLPSLIGSR